eukprot:145523-Prymnesium_polylepis.1
MASFHFSPSCSFSVVRFRLRDFDHAAGHMRPEASFTPCRPTRPGSLFCRHQEGSTNAVAPSIQLGVGLHVQSRRGSGRGRGRGRIRAVHRLLGQPARPRAAGLRCARTQAPLCAQPRLAHACRSGAGVHPAHGARWHAPTCLCVGRVARTAAAI